jgi:NAD(P)-dependent dehydrogenase (short-subunit alcohol dehydrogenase family)
MRLHGKVAIVTGGGGGRGIGPAICLEFAREGADIAIVTSRAPEAVAETARAVESAGRRVAVFQADVTNPASVRAMADQVADTFGRIDILVNSAGRGAPGPLETLDPQDWDAVFAVNAKGTFMCSVAAGRHMMRQQHGTIVNIVAASAHRSYPGAGAYGPSKAAVVSLTQQMALEWARHGIRVNGISPGAIRDPGTGWEEREPKVAKEVLALPLKRAGRTWEVARTAVFLASEDAGYMTGQMVVVDGGSTATWYLSAYLNEA